MTIGLERGTVKLVDHDPEWEKIADQTIDQLLQILGSVTKDIQHVGSTSINQIKAKPVIDIIIAVREFDEVLALSHELESKGFIFRGWEGEEKQPVFQCGEYILGEKDMRLLTHYIHIVKADSKQWHNYINFRDYMNTCPIAAKEYETLKLRLSNENKDGNLHSYHMGKQDYVRKIIQIAYLWNDLGRRFIKIEPIVKGWSEDRKYCVTKPDCTKYLLRVSDISEHDRKKMEYGMMRKVAAHGIPMSNPMDFGVCNEGKSVYTLSTWIDGEDAEIALKRMSEAEQYNLGIKAGELLHKIHFIPAPNEISDWTERYFVVIDERVNAYLTEGIPFEGIKIVLEYLENNRDLLNNRPQCFLHGDYHEGNLMVNTEGELFVIDWLNDGFGNYGDPWHDFELGENDYYSTGLLYGYFGGEPTKEFWDVRTYYMFTKALTSIVWMKYHKPDELHKNINWNELNARLIKEGHLPLTKWYLKDFYIQYIDGIPYKLKAPFDFFFLKECGTVFKVFDDQDSGNICFGIKNGDKKYFIKFAGAPTERANCSIDTAICNLRTSIAAYRDLSHKNLVKLIDYKDAGGGLVAVFEWADFECMGCMYPLSRKKFMQMTDENKMQVFEEVMAFHAHVAKCDYVAIDFYDGSIMYDFTNKKTVICDIDFYAKRPYINNMGRMWGNSRFMSPEEFTLGATIDEITNVYAMGATAFALFGIENDRCIEKWKLSKELFEVAKKAVSDDRSQRQQSIQQLMKEWEAAK